LVSTGRLANGKRRRVSRRKRSRLAATEFHSTYPRPRLPIYWVDVYFDNLIAEDIAHHARDPFRSTRLQKATRLHSAELTKLARILGLDPDDRRCGAFKYCPLHQYVFIAALFNLKFQAF
jgi:hypothetical protein